MGQSVLKSWLLAARPKTLSAAVVPVVATVGLVQAQSLRIHWWIPLFALLSSFCIQIGTNFVNDAMDFKKGADNEKRLGPQRVTQQGIFTFKQVMIMATVFFIMAVIFGIPLVLQGGWPIVAIGLISVLMGYGYTAGPYPLAYKGLGDFFVILFFGLIAVGGLYYLMTGDYNRSAFVLGLQIGFLSAVLIAINNLRDMNTDVEAGKKTLAVRLGLTGARIWICILIAAPFVTGYYWLIQGKHWLYILPAMSFPLGLYVMRQVLRTPPSTIYNKFLALSSLYSLLFSFLFFLASYL